MYCQSLVIFRMILGSKDNMVIPLFFSHFTMNPFVQEHDIFFSLGIPGHLWGHWANLELGGVFNHIFVSNSK